MEKLGKECASDEEIEEYFHTTLVSVELKRVKPSLKDYTK